VQAIAGLRDFNAKEEMNRTMALKGKLHLQLSDKSVNGIDARTSDDNIIHIY